MKRLGPALAVLLTLAEGCAEEEGTPDGGMCELAPALDPGCNGGVDGGTAAAIGLQAYTCSGGARPDQTPVYVDGIPQGMVCADQGAADGGVRNFCCTSESKTTCAYDPVATTEVCDRLTPSTYGFQCWGGNRPESLNAELHCGQGVRQGEYINYCCAGTLPPDGCVQSDGIGCSKQTMGFTCLGDSLPRAEQLGANKSRASIYYMTCPVPTPAANPKYNNYCCVVPGNMPEGGSCVTHTSVPGCAPGRFGFACYGRDNPEQDFLIMSCDAPVAGYSAQGYPATLYCCDLQPTN